MAQVGTSNEKDRTDKKQMPATFFAVKRVPGQTDKARFDLLRKISQGTVF
jgi:hypothetical protein